MSNIITFSVLTNKGITLAQFPREMLGGSEMTANELKAAAQKIYNEMSPEDNGVIMDIMPF